MKQGIDVSSAQGVIDWNQVQDHIDFALIHINSGTSQTVESRFLYNASECQRLGIPFGSYWFCYDLTPQDAYNSGVAGAQILIQNNLQNTYPLYYDLERTGDYQKPGSVEYWEQHGITPTPAFAQSIIEAFCNGVESQGVSTGLYFNAAMWNEFQYSAFLAAHPTWSRWVAAWYTTNPPSYTTWDFWQYDNRYTVPGISGAVDMDYLNDGYVPPGPGPTPVARKMPIWFYLKYPF